MCKFKSFLILKPEQEGARPRILHKRGIDSHDELMEALNVRERSSASATDQPIAKVECVPDFAKDLALDESWSFRLDEERTPDWWQDCKDWAEKECKRICRSLVVTGGEYDGEDVIVAANGSVTIRGGRVWCLGNSSAVCLGNSRAVCWGNSSAVCLGNSSAECWGSSRAVCWGNSSAVCLDNSSAECWGSSRAVPKSRYAICVRRGEWDGTGYLWTLIPFVEDAK